MRTKKFACMLVLSLLVILLTSCSTSTEKERTLTAVVESLSNPYMNEFGLEVVKINWATNQRSTTGGGFLIELGEANGYRLWEAYPADKFSQELLGKVLDKEVELTYRLIRNENPPIIYLVKWKFVWETD